MPEGGTLTLSTHEVRLDEAWCAASTSAIKPGTYLRLSVQDTGTGIAAEDLERLWRPFEQGASDAVVQFGGAGLGLAITRGLVELLDGTVTVHSAPGAGSRFAVDLAAPATAEEPRKGILRPDLPAGAKVLVVEDNPTNQLLVQEQLARLGVNATVVATGEDAVAELQPGHPYSMVLMDWQLPGIDGLEATRQAREAEPAGTHVPIVAMTASAMPTDAQKARSAGMDDLLAKPVGLAALATSIQRWVVEGAAGATAITASAVAPGARIDPAARDELVAHLADRVIASCVEHQFRFFRHLLIPHRLVEKLSNLLLIEES
jgi:two-component system sensor histidine kinase EvgS